MKSTLQPELACCDAACSSALCVRDVKSEMCLRVGVIVIYLVTSIYYLRYLKVPNVLVAYIATPTLPTSANADRQSAISAARRLLALLDRLSAPGCALHAPSRPVAALQGSQLPSELRAGSEARGVGRCESVGLVDIVDQGREEREEVEKGETKEDESARGGGAALPRVEGRV